MSPTFFTCPLLASEVIWPRIGDEPKLDKKYNNKKENKRRNGINKNSQLKRGWNHRLCLVFRIGSLFCGTKDQHRSHGVMVSTLDFESSDPSSNLGGTYRRSTFFLDLFLFL